MLTFRWKSISFFRLGIQCFISSTEFSASCKNNEIVEKLHSVCRWEPKHWTSKHSLHQTLCMLYCIFRVFFGRHKIIEYGVNNCNLLWLWFCKLKNLLIANNTGYNFCLLYMYFKAKIRSWKWPDIQYKIHTICPKYNFFPGRIGCCQWYQIYWFSGNICAWPSIQNYSSIHVMICHHHPGLNPINLSWPSHLLSYITQIDIKGTLTRF